VGILGRRGGGKWCCGVGVMVVVEAELVGWSVDRLVGWSAD
jgi:hypothetical protein